MALLPNLISHYAKLHVIDICKNMDQGQEQCKMQVFANVQGKLEADNSKEKWIPKKYLHMGDSQMFNDMFQMNVPGRPDHAILSSLSTLTRGDLVQFVELSLLHQFIPFNI